MNCDVAMLHKSLVNIRQTCLQFLIGHVLSKLLCHPLQIFEADFASLIIIKQPEGLQDLLLQGSAQAITSVHCHSPAASAEIAAD